MTKKQLLLAIFVVVSLHLSAVTPTGKNWRVVLPASQWTPAEQWSAQTMIFNNNEGYTDASYNKIIGTPPADSNGKAWYEPDYRLTNGTFKWTARQSPFSSDENYKGYPSTQWALSGIMADIYIRRTFTVDKGFGGDLYLSCGHDDAPAEYYINGVLVRRVSDGWNNDDIIRLTPEQRELVKTDGTENLIAVHVHQNYGGAFADCGLYESLTENTVSILPSMPEVSQWPCVYYTLNSNAELTSLTPNTWAGLCVDESDWAYGNGPFSNSRDAFFVSEWASTVQPLLVRRHFTLTAEDLEDVLRRKFTLVCSYDEEPKVYLNGTLIWSKTGYSGDSYTEYVLTTNNKRQLREGDNVLAISLQQGVGSGHVDFGFTTAQPYVDPTGIENVPHAEAEPQPSEGLYDLQGRKIADNSPSTTLSLPFQYPSKKGIYIYNGKKIIIK